jgi:hypothetical protein
VADEDIARRVAEQLSGSGFELAVPTDVLKTRVVIEAHVTHSAGELTVIDVRLAPPPPPRKTCHHAELTDLVGYGRTGADGSVILDIRKIVCWDLRIEGEDEFWFVATPRSSEPVYLTHLVLGPAEPLGTLPPPNPSDIQVRIFAWDRTGRPKSDVSFTWRVLLHGNFDST